MPMCATRCLGVGVALVFSLALLSGCGAGVAKKTSPSGAFHFEVPDNYTGEFKEEKQGERKIEQCVCAGSGEIQEYAGMRFVNYDEGAIAANPALLEMVCSQLAQALDAQVTQSMVIGRPGMQGWRIDFSAPDNGTTMHGRMEAWVKGNDVYMFGVQTKTAEGLSGPAANTFFSSPEFK